VLVIHRTALAKVLTAGSALTLLAGCGASASSSSNAPAPNSGPVRGGNLIFANPQDAQSFNQTNVFDNNSIWILEQITQPLYTVTSNGKSVMPWLATGYTESPDKMTYTFTLRSGVKFSTGQPMTSADVKFTLEQTIAASAGWGYIDAAIKSVDAPSPSTVVVHLKYPWAPLLADLSLFANGIVPNNFGGETAT
jgi:peptide/nickel transport system substrate-binding protein